MVGETSEVKAGRVDYDLLIRRLESALADEKGRERVRNLVAGSSLWMSLPPEQAVKWAEIAAAVGRTDVAKKVLEYVTDAYPDCIAAWKSRCDLLERPQPAQEEKFDPGDSFDRYRAVERGLKRYMEIFRGREDCFARQWVDRESRSCGYSPVRRPITEKDVLDHLKGLRTYGIYLLQKDSHVRLGVIDVDCGLIRKPSKLSPGEKQQVKDEVVYVLRRLPELAGDLGLKCLCEFSGGKGYHFWFPVNRPVPAAKMRLMLAGVKNRLEKDLKAFTLEVFPKQDRLSGKGLGNLVKLPLGVHRLTGKKSFFLNEKDRSLEAQLEFLERVELNDANLFESVEGAPSPAVLIHPEHSAWERSYPELAALSKRCSVLSHLIYGCIAGRHLTLREEKVLLGTISFLKRGRTLLHHLLKRLPDYNPHLVDYKISRVRGTPLGCKTIHRLLGVAGDFCIFEHQDSYDHPLLHLRGEYEAAVVRSAKAERVENLQDALDLLRTAIESVQRFLPGGGGCD
ncbi:CRISPR-associated primase-polymerase type A1 [Thermodesulforhabdus norvegica]|uniref:TOTE conflict system primase domain-containing protein n=1 Tax=Thermodesulforhabdus norvegica TaxID=39841 RepID=A0A1I4TAV9_9BACT|nr:CRISPR-associated primase-polymerase type A1 [Thermodesulforhabdus norvegica]SFM73826.1 hypothetical protein SAMN05660836_01318 [Thermodesulforhabdus norvegica]